LLAGGDDGTHPDMNSSKCSCWPHGERQLSPWCNKRCHG
jgi:hypothetical protein